MWEGEQYIYELKAFCFLYFLCADEGGWVQMFSQRNDVKWEGNSEGKIQESKIPKISKSCEKVKSDDIELLKNWKVKKSKSSNMQNMWNSKIQ